VIQSFSNYKGGVLVSLSKDVDKYTITEIIEHWFSQNEDRHITFEHLMEEVLRLYFVGNKTVDAAIEEIKTLEYTHHCDVTEEAKLLLLTIPLPKITIIQLVERIRDHVTNE
jgi:hypothetical protein